MHNNIKSPLDRQYRSLFFVGLLAYFFLLLLSLLFYRERTTFVDLAFHLFELCRRQELIPQNYRFIAIFTQLPPYLGIRMGWPLEILMLLYSAAFSLLYLAVYAMIGLLRSYRIALLLLFVNTLFVTHTFYWAQSELPQGLAFMMLAWSLVRHDSPRRPLLRKSLLILLLFLVAFAHPLLLFPFLFMAAYYWLEEQDRVKRRYLLRISLLYLFLVAVKSLFLRTGYDNHSFSGLKNFYLQFPDYFTLYSNKRLLGHFAGPYLMVPVSVVAIVIVYLRQRAYKKLLLFSCSFLGYLLLINVSYPDNRTPDFYIENLYLPLGVFISLPLVYDILPMLVRSGYSKAVLVLVPGILLFACIRIFSRHEQYSARLNWMAGFWQRHKNEKLVIRREEVPMDTLLMTWGTPYEFWLLSTSRNNESASLIVTDETQNMEWAFDDPRIFLSTWGTHSYKDLPARYFRFRDTTGHYQYMTPAPKGNAAPGD